MRPIDAEPLEELFRSRCAQLSNSSGSFAGAVSGCLKLVQAQPTIVPPPNAPLTLKELREMDGEPVWISPVKENRKIRKQWMLTTGYNQKKDIYLFAPASNIIQGYDGNSYGKTWLAYRRRPEEAVSNV